jgi:transcriptional regulator with XRE-family HTH domain
MPVHHEARTMQAKPVAAPATFASRLQTLRLAAKLSAADLAVRTGLRLRDVLSLEAGKQSPSFADACRLADALGCSLEDFRGG